MTLYALFVKSDMLDITPEVLNVFLKLSGYDASIFEDIKTEPEIKVMYNIINFADLKEAQKAEVEIRKWFTCFLLNTDTNQRLVLVTTFKETRKYSDSFSINIPAETKDFDVVDAIIKSEAYKKYFVYHGRYANNVPFIIPAHSKPNVKPYQKNRRIK